MKLPRAILADDHTLVAEALCGLIALHFDVVATVADGHALVAAATALKPDVIVVDIAMPLLNGLDACRQLKQRMPSIKFVFLTMNEDPELAVEAVKSGACGYVLKKSAASELLQAMQLARLSQGLDRCQRVPQLLPGIGDRFGCALLDFVARAGRERRRPVVVARRHLIGAGPTY